MTYTPPPIVASLNPYHGLHSSDAECLRISQDLSRSDVFRIRSVVMDYGFLNAAICRFVKHLYTVCEHNNYTISDRDTLINYVYNHCTTTPNTVGPTPCRSDVPGNRPIDVDLRRRLESMDTNAPRASDVKRPRRRK